MTVEGDFRDDDRRPRLYLAREQIGWIRHDGDEYFDFRYSSPGDVRPGPLRDFYAKTHQPVYVLVEKETA